MAFRMKRRMIPVGECSETAMSKRLKIENVGTRTSSPIKAYRGAFPVHAAS